MMTLLLHALLLAPATAGRETVHAANDVVRDGVHGFELTLDGDEASVLRRLGVPLDPASQRVYPVLTGPRGRVLLDGRRIQGVDPDVNRATTTPALPADDARHVFFVPYHRLDLPPGQHTVGVALYLDPAEAGAVRRVFEPVPVSVRMPPLDWAFTAVEHRAPPKAADAGVRWRARVGKDVVAERDLTPAVVVLGERDALDLDVWDVDRGRWVEMDGRSLGRAARVAGLTSSQVRALEVRKAPPHVERGSVQAKATQRGEQPGWLLELAWTLDGRSVDALIPVEARPYIADAKGQRWPLPVVPLSEGPDRASLFAPAWGLPRFVEAGDRLRFGWDLVARAGKGSPLTRDLALGGLELDQVAPDGGATAPLQARVAAVDLVEDDGLTLRVEVRWSLPEGLPGPSPERTPRLTAGWVGGPTVTGPWTPCLPDGPACAEAWSAEPVSDRHGATLFSLPLAALASEPTSTPALEIRANIEGYRGASTRVEPRVDLPPTRAVQIRPRKAKLECPEGSTVRLTVAAGGSPIASTTPRPCTANTRWSADDVLEVRAFDADLLTLDLEVDGRTRRREEVRVEPGRWRPELAEATVGVRAARVDVVIE